MYDIMVLGQIPGTNLVIDFTMWLQLMALLIAVTLYVSAHRRHEHRTLAPIQTQNDLQHMLERAL
mgnify:FL=1